MGARKLETRDQGLARAIEGAGGVRALARALGLSPSSVCRWEVAPKDLLFKIEKASGVDAAEVRPDLADWIEAERHRNWMAAARKKMGLSELEGAKATARRANSDAAVMDMIDLGLVVAAVRFVGQRRGLDPHAIITAKGGAGGAPTPEQSARSLAMGLVVTVGRVSSETVAAVMGGTRQAVDNAAERYLRSRDGDDADDMMNGRVIERGRLRRAKAADESLWTLQRAFVDHLSGVA